MKISLSILLLFMSAQVYSQSTGIWIEPIGATYVDDQPTPEPSPCPDCNGTCLEASCGGYICIDGVRTVNITHPFIIKKEKDYLLNTPAYIAFSNMFNYSKPDIYPFQIPKN